MLFNSAQQVRIDDTFCTVGKTFVKVTGTDNYAQRYFFLAVLQDRIND